ncbi:hypothetical protein SZ64_16945 [Erythrobacter sp. SG61-1L]|nr:hypothetical protein SZ64_16945 [Erythrobacter sp. SG61-1L]
MDLPNFQVIIHDEALDDHTQRKIKTPYLNDVPACYADLVLSDVVFSRVTARGQSLKSYIHFRQFSPDSDLPVRHLSTWVETKLHNFRDGEKADIPASDAELPGALIQNIEKFAGFLSSPRKKN